MNQTLSLVDLESYDTHAKRSGNEWRFLCPLCGDGKPRDENHRSFALNKSTGAYQCFRCKGKGLLKDNWEPKTAKPRKARTAAALARAFSVEAIPSPAYKQKTATETDQQKAKLKLDRLKSKMEAWQSAFDGSPAQDYLQSRGISPETAKAFGCGYAEKWEHWRADDQGRLYVEATDRRVVFPMTDADGEFIALHGRAIDARHCGSPKISKGDKSLGVFQTADALESEIVAIVEGPVDAMALYQCGMPVAAIVGTSADAWLTSALAFRKVFVATDNDDAGNDAAEKLIADFRSFGARSFRLCPDGVNDWGEYLERHGPDALRTRLEQKTVEAFTPYLLHSTSDIQYSANLQNNITQTEPSLNLAKVRQTEAPTIIEDVFSIENESGQSVIDYLFGKIKEFDTSAFLLAMPTVKAYENEINLVAAVQKHQMGELSDDGLTEAADRFIDAHLRSGDVQAEWTGKDVPLFHLTLRMNGERVDNITCNQIQSWIIREFWLRKSPEAGINIINL
jgi:DNA primase